MTRYDLAKLMKKYFNGRMNIMHKKSQDYAQDTDALSNFKLVAGIIGTSVNNVILMFIATKVVRLGNLMSKGIQPNNESLLDTLDDLNNYSDILHAHMEQTQTEIKGTRIKGLPGMRRKDYSGTK